MSRANETSGAADAAAGGSTEHETSGHGASTLGSRTPDSQTFITALDHTPSGDSQRLARRQRAYEAAIAAASAAAAELKQKIQLREQALRRPGLESVEFVFDAEKPTALPEGVDLGSVLAESCVENASRVSEAWRRDWIADITGTPEVGDLVKDVFWWTFSAHLRLDPKVVQARHKRRELREQRDALERVQHVALGLGVRPREELGADASRTGLAPTAKQSPALESGAETQSAASAPPLTLRRLLEGFAVSDPSTLEPRGKAHAASPTEEADGGEERAGGAGEGGPEWITAPQIVAAVSSVTVDPAEEEAEEARTATAQESARARMFDRMSSRYVAVLLRAPKGPRRDSFLEHLPDVVAQSAFKSFFLAFPRARVRFGTVFRTQLFDLCQEWFTGIRPSQPPPLSHWDQPGAADGVPPSHPKHPRHAAYTAAKGQRQHVLKLRHESLARDKGSAAPGKEDRRPQSALLEHARPRPIRTRYVLAHSPFVRSRLAGTGALGGSVRQHGVYLTLVEDAERPMMAAASPAVRRPPLRRRVAERLMQLSGTTTGKAVVNPASVLRATVNTDELRAPASSAREAALYMSSSGGTGTFAVNYKVERGTTKGDILFGVADEDGPEPFEEDDTFNAVSYGPSGAGSSGGSGAGRPGTAAWRSGTRGDRGGGRSLPPLLSGRAAWVPPLSSIRLSREETGDDRDTAPDAEEGHGTAQEEEESLPRPVLPHSYAFARAVAVAPPFAVASPAVEQPPMAQGPFASASWDRTARGSSTTRTHTQTRTQTRTQSGRGSCPVASPPHSRSGARTASASQRSGASPVRRPSSPSSTATTTTEEEEEEAGHRPAIDALHPPMARGPLSRVEDVSAGTGSLSLLTSPSLHGAPPSVEAMEAAARQELQSRAGEEAARRRAAQASAEVNEVVASDAAFRRRRPAAQAATLPRPHTGGALDQARARTAAAEASGSRRQRAEKEWGAWQRRRRAQLGTATLSVRPATHAGTRAPASRRGSRGTVTGMASTTGRGPPQSAGPHHRAATAASERQREIAPWHRHRVLNHRLFRLRKLLREGRAGQAEVEEAAAIEAKLQGGAGTNAEQQDSAKGRGRGRAGYASPPGSAQSHSAVRRQRRQQRRFVTRRRGGAEDEAAPSTPAEEEEGGGGGDGLGLASLDQTALAAAGGAFSRLRGAQAEAESKETRGAGEYFTHCVTYRDVVRLSQRRAGRLLDEYFAARRRTQRDLGEVEVEAERAKAARRRELAELRRRSSPAEVSEYMLAEQAKREEAKREALRDRISQRTRQRELQQLLGPHAVATGAAVPDASGAGGADEDGYDDRQHGFYSAYHRGGAPEGASRAAS